MKRLVQALVLLLVAGLMIGCTLPAAPPYPDANPTTLTSTANQISANLEAYVKDWMAGTVPAKIPRSLLPDGIDFNSYYDHEVVNPDTITAEQQWGIRNAAQLDLQNGKTIDLNNTLGANPDPHCMYACVGSFVAPFGTKVTIKGKFPYCRYFEIQASPPFNPMLYTWNVFAGSGEPGFLDVDITPDNGSVNPFRPGANRLATNRSYTVNFDLKVGNHATLLPAYNPVNNYRIPNDPTNTRPAGGIQYQGPWGDPNAKMDFGLIGAYSVNGRGKWNHGMIWIRNYRPDLGKEATAGVPLPKIEYKLADGRKYYINCNWQNWINQVNVKKPQRATVGENQTAQMQTEIWEKMYGIFMAIEQGVVIQSLGKNTPADLAYVRALDLGVTGRGETQPAPGNWEINATAGNHISYFGKKWHICIKDPYVLTLTGKLPTFPNTKNGASTMANAEMRYWSLVTYDNTDADSVDGDPNKRTANYGHCNTAICDDELVLDANRRYVIAYSGAGWRPTNSYPVNKVTWVNWGTTMKQMHMWRWISVKPDHFFAKSPDEFNLPWRKVVNSGMAFDPNMMMLANKHNGFLGWYQPVFKTMPKTEFEKFGAIVTPEECEAYAGCGRTLGTGSSSGVLALLPLLLIVLANIIWFARRKR